MKIISPLPHKRGRLEIIPLIDIMFFLLAAFMIVSINKIKVDSLKISLPTEVPSYVHESKEDFISISLDMDGNIAVGNTKVTTKEEFLGQLQSIYAKNPDQKLLISADREARHGDVMMILGKIRQAGFQHVAFSLKNEHNPNAGAGMDNPAAPGPNAPPPPAPAAPAAPDSSMSAPAAPAPAGAAAPAPGSTMAAPAAPGAPAPTMTAPAPAAAPAAAPEPAPAPAATTPPPAH
jgi:biopolymer transport protein ExbD